MSGKVTIIGLGSGNEDQLSLGIYKILKNAEHLYLRTNIHPVVNFLDTEGITYETFDYLYKSMYEYEQVYKKISINIINQASSGTSIVYAVPGHPMVAEKSVQNIIEMGKKNNISVEVIGGESFLDTLFSRVQIDPIDGFIFINGEDITSNDIDPTKNIVIGQVYNKYIASDIKLTLMELYPDEFIVTIVSNLGVDDKEEIKKIPLFELDHYPDDFHHLSSLFIPKTSERKVLDKKFSKLIQIVKILRGPDGCPWDKAQTHQTIRKNMIEEAYELVETIDIMDIDHMVEELGDVLLQVLLHAQIGEDEGYFNIYDVIYELNNKLVRRHPHVFQEEKANNPEEALVEWDKVKKAEKELKRNEKGNMDSVITDIPKDLPVMYYSYKLQKKVAKVGFDWDDVEDIYNKIYEEIDELKNAKKEERILELGDLLFAVINLARFYNIDPEESLMMTNRKFINRFNFIEQKLKEQNISIDEASLELMDKYWNLAKREEGEVYENR